MSVQARMDFKQLSWEEFEDLSRALLEEEEFINVVSLGRTAQGVDLLAEEVRPSHVGQTEVVRWVVQCKHYASSGRKVTANELPIVINTVNKHKAHGLLVITSTELTQGAIEILQGLNESGKCKTHWWDLQELYRRLVWHPKMVGQFFGSEAKAWAEGEQERTDIIQVAVVAMVRKQAEELDTAGVFSDLMVSEGEREHWREFKTALQKCSVKDFTLCYDKMSRDEWKPLMADQRSIREIARGVADRLNRERKRRTVHIEHLSTFLSLDPGEHRRARDALETRGGVLIVDAISLYHPGLRRLFVDSQLVGRNNRIAMAVISPLESRVLQIKQLLEEQAYKLYMSKALDFCTELNPRYEFGVSDILGLRRWLYSMLQVLEAGGLTLEQSDGIQDQTGMTRRGYDTAIAGRYLR